MTTMKYLFRYSFILYLAFGCKIALAQDSTNFKRFQIGVSVSPDVCYRSLTPHSIFLSSNKDNPKIGYTIGANVCYQIIKSIGLETGIKYSNKGYKNIYIYRNTQNLQMTNKLYYSYHYIDFPIKINILIIEKKINFFSSMGFTTNFLIKDSMTAIYIYPNGDKKTEKSGTTDSPINRINFSPTVSIGMNYKINDRISLRIEPEFRHSLIRTIDKKNYPYSEYLWNLGINIGFYWGL